MSVDAVLQAGRDAAEQLMTDRCIITRRGAEVDVDPETGEYPENPPDAVYAGPCRVQVPNLVEQTLVAGAEPVTLQVAIVVVPITATGIRVDDVARITASEHDPELVDRDYRVVAVHSKSHATARRVRCEEVTG